MDEIVARPLPDLGSTPSSSTTSPEQDDAELLALLLEGRAEKRVYFTSRRPGEILDRPSGDRMGRARLLRKVAGAPLFGRPDDPHVCCFWWIEILPSVLPDPDDERA